MESSTANIHPLPLPNITTWTEEYQQEILATKDPATIDAYTRILRFFLTWLAQKPGNFNQFHPQSLTHVAVQTYINSLKSYSHKKQARAAISSFCRWLVEDKRLLDRNPATRISIPPQALLAPKELNDDQRFAIKNLVDRESDLRGKAAFALGYWAGCRVSDVSWLLRDQTHLTKKAGYITIGHKGGKERTIDLTNEARLPLFDYLEETEPKSAYIFLSQRCKQTTKLEEQDGWRWTEEGIHQWWQSTKLQAKVVEAELVHDIEFHDLRHDFAHRARQTGWSLEEIAYYLGHITNSGTPAIQTTIRYVQVSRETLKRKIKNIQG
jgi:site-specific recombinase XerD